jgi:hypothetical protein
VPQEFLQLRVFLQTIASSSPFGRGFRGQGFSGSCDRICNSLGCQAPTSWGSQRHLGPPGRASSRRIWSGAAPAATYGATPAAHTAGSFEPTNAPPDPSTSPIQWSSRVSNLRASSCRSLLRHRPVTRPSRARVPVTGAQPVVACAAGPEARLAGRARGSCRTTTSVPPGRASEGSWCSDC